MPRCIAFLRAVNVGGRTVKMEELRALFVKLCFANVETFIASGNVIFDAKPAPDAALEKKIELPLKKWLGYPVPVFVRTVDEVAAIATNQGFKKAEMQKAQAHNVLLLKAPLNAEQIKLATSFATDVDAFQIHGREVYWLCRLKQNESKFTNAAFERKLKVASTIRGMKTMQKLAAKFVSASEASGGGQEI